MRRLSSLLDHPLEMTSRVGLGTAFRITLPRAPAEPAPEAAREIDPRLPLAGLRVLCVDNEPAILDALSALLTRWGARPTLAAGVEQAWAAGVEFDAAVVDLHLGEGPDGFAVIDRLRPRGVRRIALVTADTRDGLKEQATAAGAVLLPKPIKPATLKAFLSS